MRSTITCLARESEFFLQYLFILIVSVACLYNISKDIEIEFSKILLSSLIGLICPNPRFKRRQNSQNSQNSQDSQDNQQQNDNSSPSTSHC